MPQSRCEALYRMLRACWPLCRRHGCERQLLEDNMAELRRCWGHPGIAKAIEVAREMGVRT